MFACSYTKWQVGGRVRALGLALTIPALLSAVAAPVEEDGDRAGDLPWLSTQRGCEAPAADDTTMSDMLAGAEARVGAMEVEAREAEAFYSSEVEPLVRDLVWLGGDSTLANRIATALVREGRHSDIDPRLLLAVMRVENPWLATDTLSSAGAVGLMQVMPFHAGGWGCAGDDLTDPDVNICHGTRILSWLLDRFDGDLERALLGYNGCVLGVSTSNCHEYPAWVLGHAGSPWGERPRGQLVAANGDNDGLVD